MSKDANLVWPYPPGTTVIYTSVRDDPRTARLTRTTTDAWDIGNEAEVRILVGVEGVSGGVWIRHLAVVSASQLDEAHARTQAWLDKFQGLAADKEVELLKWRAWAREFDSRDGVDDDGLRESITLIGNYAAGFKP
jgi:hypothetical protein